jgi:hypothetical protein
VLIIHPTRQAKAVGIDQSLEQITQADLSDALAPLAVQAGRPEPLSKTEMTLLAPAR